MTDITIIMCGVAIILVGIVGIVLVKYVMPWVKTKINADQWSTIVEWAKALVALAEKTIYGEHGLGQVRFDKVFEQLQSLCNKYQFKFDENTLKAAIQYAWQTVIGISDTEKEEAIDVNVKPEVSE